MPAISRRLAFTMWGPKRTDYLLPLKGSTYSLILSLSIIWSSFSCSLIYFCIVAVFNPTVLTYYPSAQKCLFPNLYFKFACLSNIIIALLPFRYPITCDILYFGGIDSSKCMWSDIICPSIISIPFHLHKSFIIFCMSALNPLIYYLSPIFWRKYYMILA